MKGVQLSKKPDLHTLQCRGRVNTFLKNYKEDLHTSRLADLNTSN